MELTSHAHQSIRTAVQPPSDEVAMEQHLLSINFAAASSAVLDAALELNIADQLRDGPRTAEELAESAGWCQDGTRRLLRALNHLKIVAQADHDRYYVPQAVAELLSQSSIGSIADHLKAVYANQSSWREVANTVRSGARTNRLGTIADRIDNSAFFMRGGHQLLREARFVASLAASQKSDTTVVLYSGGGEWALAQAEAGNASTIYAVDHPAFLDRTRALIETHPTAARIELVPSETEIQSYPMAASIVVLPPILRFLNEISAFEVIAAAIANLDPDGELFVVEVTSHSGGVPSLRPMLDLSLLVNTAAGSIRDVQYYQELVERGGGQLVDQHDTGMLTVLHVRRRKS